MPDMNKMQELMKQFGGGSARNPDPVKPGVHNELN